jgi:hypothetical protein
MPTDSTNPQKRQAGVLVFPKYYQKLIVYSNENITEAAISDDEKMSIN